MIHEIPKDYNLNVCAQCDAKFLMKVELEICHLCFLKRDEFNYQRGLKDAMQWINIKERSPKINKPVLFSDGKYIDIGFITERNECFCMGSHLTKSKPLYWMPLPEAPK